MAQDNDGRIRGPGRHYYVTITCAHCGKSALARADGPRRFCSRRCTGAAKSGESHHNWKGTEASYTSKHDRVRHQRGSADRCERCGRTDPAGKYEWASLTGNYDDIWDYQQMCKVCHEAYDHQIGSGHYDAKLTEQIVTQIRQRHAAGESQRSLAKEFGVAIATIHRAVTRRDLRFGLRNSAKVGVTRADGRSIWLRTLP